MTLLNASGEATLPTEDQLKEADSLVELITLTFATADDGRPFWVYAAIRPSRYQAFMADTTAKNHINVDDYGWAIAFGYGTEVPAETKQQMVEIYGFDENYPATLLKKAKEENAGRAKKKEDDRLAGIVAMLKAQQKPT